MTMSFTNVLCNYFVKIDFREFISFEKTLCGIALTSFFK